MWNSIFLSAAGHISLGDKYDNICYFNTYFCQEQDIMVRKEEHHKEFNTYTFQSGAHTHTIHVILEIQMPKKTYAHRPIQR